MMRILFTTHPAYGHFHPLLPFAAAARDAGHEVAFAASALFGPVIETTGFIAFAAGLPWLLSEKSTIPDELRSPPGTELEPFFAQQFVAATAERLARDVVGMSASWAPDIIVRERTEYGGSIAAALLGVPIAVVQIATPTLMTPALLAAVEPPYNRAREALGLAPDAGLRALDDQVVFSAAPPSLHDPGVHLPRNLISIRPIALDAAPTTGLPEWAEDLGATRPLVYATLGTVFNEPKYELPFFPAVIEGLRDEPLDVVITVGPNVDPASLGRQPSNIRVERYIPQRLLLPRCSVVVCHGGYGTLLASIEHGVPLVVVPFGADQPINARAISRLGLGQVIDEEDLTADRMRSAVWSAINEPVWRTNMERLRDEGRALPPTSEAIRIMERLVADAAA